MHLSLVPCEIISPKHNSIRNRKVAKPAEANHSRKVPVYVLWPLRRPGESLLGSVGVHTTEC